MITNLQYTKCRYHSSPSKSNMWLQFVLTRFWFVGLISCSKSKWIGVRMKVNLLSRKICSSRNYQLFRRVVWHPAANSALLPRYTKLEWHLIDVDCVYFLHIPVQLRGAADDLLAEPGGAGAVPRLHAGVQFNRHLQFRVLIWDKFWDNI